MPKRRDLVKQRRSRLAQRDRRRQWMARVILVGLTGMLILSVTLTLWPPMPEIQDSPASPSPGEVTAPGSEMPFPEELPPGAAPPPGDPAGNPFAGENPVSPEAFDQLQLDLFHEYGWQPPGPPPGEGPPGMEGEMPPGMEGEMPPGMEGEMPPGMEGEMPPGEMPEPAPGQ